MAENKIMSVVDGVVCFGDYTLAEKAKLEESFGGDTYKVKTFNEMTKLEKNGMFVYESVPGTSVKDFAMSAEGVTFTVEGDSSEDAQIIVGLEDDTEYQVVVNDNAVGTVKTNLGGKLNFSVDLSAGKATVSIKK